MRRDEERAPDPPWIGISSFDDWRAARFGQDELPELDVVLVAHPRDEHDMPRLASWSIHLTLEERRALVHRSRPTFGEIIETQDLRIGILFLPFFAFDLIEADTRRAARKILEGETLSEVAEAGARILCLGGLTGALSGYGRRLVKSAAENGITITTGHAVTAISVFRTFERAAEQLMVRISDSDVVVLGVGSIGGGFVHLLANSDEQPRRIVLVDRPNAEKRVLRLAHELGERSSASVATEFVDVDGSIPRGSSCYRTRFLISAISTPHIIDADQVASGTILVDDSQPYCWARERAWDRCTHLSDVAPCEAGLVDCASLGYRSHFPFDFADHDEMGSTTAWSCLTEGLLLALDDTLGATIGEPTIEQLLAYDEAFDRWHLTTPALQCGAHVLPIDELRLRLAAGVEEPRISRVST